MAQQWREPILRLLALGALRFSEIKQGLAAEYGDRAPLDGQLTKVLRSLQRRGYARKPPGRNSPWVATELGKFAIDVVDQALRPGGAGAYSGQAAPTVSSTRDGNQWGSKMDERIEASMDTTRAHPARRYDYFLGGKNHFEADRISGEEFAAMFPTVRLAARENRDFLGRAVSFLASRAGIRQFLDIGPGLPTANNTHEIAQDVAPDAHIVYVDNDPMVITHAQALLTSSPEGTTAYLHADLREPDTILAHPTIAATLDLSQPVGLILVAVLHFVHGEGAAKPIVDTLLDALPPGSCLVATHVTHEFLDEATRNSARDAFESGKSDVWPRSRPEFAELFDGLELFEPGITQASEWRRDLDSKPPAPEDISLWAAVGRKP
jgi:hypothetical protein